MSPRSPSQPDAGRPAREPSLAPEVEALARGAFRAAREGDVPTLLRGLDRGVPVELCNEEGNTLLMLAVYHARHATAALLLDRGADPERPNDRGQTPLAAAAFKGDLDATLLLLDAGARVDAVGPDGRTALMYAAMFDHLDVLEVLLQAGANASLSDRQGQGPLGLARVMGARRTEAVLSARVRALS